MFIENTLSKKLLLIIGLFLLINLCTCGFAYEKQITDKYYVIGVDTEGELGLSYKLGSGDYVGKAPGRLLQYGNNATFLVAKTQESKNSNPAFYIIDMAKDSELAQEETFRIGPLTEEEYNRSWNQKLNIQLKVVK